MLSREDIFDMVSETMHEIFEIDVKTIKPETKLMEDLGLDSIDAIDLAARVEELTNQRLAEEQLRGLRTVDDIVTLIHGMVTSMPHPTKSPP
jgi:acyl carrier protein